MFRVNRSTHGRNQTMRNQPDNRSRVCCPKRSRTKSFFWFAVALMLIVGTLQNASSAPAPASIRVFEDCSFASAQPLPPALVAINAQDDETRERICAVIFPDWYTRFN
jgi:hypothetical protein